MDSSAFTPVVLPLLQRLKNQSYIYFPDCMQQGFWVQIKPCHLDAFLWDLKSGSDAEVMPCSCCFGLFVSGKQSHEMPTSSLQVQRCWEETVGATMAEFHVPVSRLGWVATALWSQLSGTWILAREVCLRTHSSKGRQTDWLPWAYSMCPSRDLVIANFLLNPFYLNTGGNFPWQSSV